MRAGTRVRTIGPIQMLAGSEVVTVLEGTIGTVISSRINAPAPFGAMRVVAFDPGDAREQLVAGPVVTIPEIDLEEI